VAAAHPVWGCRSDGPAKPNGVTPMLWTILIILAIIALVLFILGRVRGGRKI
jgi:hypothetical protein